MPIHTRRLRCALLLLGALAACGDATGPGGPDVNEDSAAPFAEITLPVAAGRSPAQLRLAGRATDAVAVTRATYQLDGGPETQLSLITGSSSPSASQVAFETILTLPAGAHSAVVHAYDAAGNRGSSAVVQFQVDASGPQIQLATPAALTIAADTLRVRATVTDDYNLGLVDLALGTRGVFRFIAANRGQVTQYAVDTLVSLAVGANEINVVAYDSVGNETRARVVATRTAAPGPARFDLIAAHNVHGCGLRAGTAFCWGDGSLGALGNGRTLPRDTPVPVSGGHVFATLAAGWGRNCGLTPGGTAYCWGSDFYAALGRGASVAGGLATPQRVATDVRLTALSAGSSGYTTCALSVDGEAYCWGANAFGQAGVPRSTGTCDVSGGASPCVVAPARVQGGRRFTSISIGASSTCAVAVDGRAYCWGANGPNGMLGNGEVNTISETPVPVAGGLAFASVSVGDSHACGVTTSQELYCWGSNRGGALGDGTAQNRLVPTRIAPTLAFVSAGIIPEVNGQGAGTCARSDAGPVYCWGAGRAVPERLEGGLTFTSLSPNHRCGLTADRTAYCWTPTSAPVPVPGDYPAGG